VRDSAGHLRRVFGSPGAFLVGPPEYAGALSVEFNGKTGRVKTARELLELDREGNLVGQVGRHRLAQQPRGLTAGPVLPHRPPAPLALQQMLIPPPRLPAIQLSS